jgi:hypothetical protein
MLCDEVHPQTSEATSTEQALNRLSREIALDIATCLKDIFLWVRSQGKGCSGSHHDASAGASAIYLAIAACPLRAESVQVGKTLC